MEAGLSLGSNISSRSANLAEAKRRILEIPGVTLVAQSPLYETEPVGVKPEFKHLDFVNAVLVIETPGTAHELYDKLRKIEDDVGRHRTIDRFAPRPIDIDIIYFGNDQIESGGLCIPHPQWSKRRFVLQPLADVRPDLVLPGTTKTVKQTLDELKPGEDVWKYGGSW